MEKICLCCKNKFVNKDNYKFCSRECYLSIHKKGIDGYKNCEFCSKQMPFRNSLKARNYKNIYSIKSRFCCKLCSLSFRNKSNEQRLKVSEAIKGRPSKLKGIKRPIESVLKGIRRGAEHWNWKGGISPKNHAERSCIENKEWRRLVFKRDNYTCQVCGQRGGRLEADHIKPWAKFPEFRFELTNGRTLCRNCHIETPTYRGRINRVNIINSDTSVSN